MLIAITTAFDSTKQVLFLGKSAPCYLYIPEMYWPKFEAWCTEKQAEEQYRNEIDQQFDFQNQMYHLVLVRFYFRKW